MTYESREDELRKALSRAVRGFVRIIQDAEAGKTTPIDIIRAHAQAAVMARVRSKEV